MADAIRYVLYARKSTDVEDKQVRSIDAQLAELNEFAQRNALSVWDVVVEKESAKTPGHRRLFNAMLDKVERGEFQGILAWHPDRLARNMTDGGRVIDLVDTGKLRSLRFPTFWFDDTPQGKFMLSMAFSQSKYYIDSLSENVRRGQREKVRRGEYPGPAPLGYVNDRYTKRIAVDPKKAVLVKNAFELYATGTATLDTLRDFFAAHGLFTRRAGRFPGKRKFGRNRIGQMLANPIYYGHFRYGGEVYEGIHEPLISKRLFDRTQEILHRRYRWHPSVLRKTPKAYTGLLRCAECGYAVSAEIQKGHTYYRCSKMSRAGLMQPVRAGSKAATLSG